MDEVLEIITYGPFTMTTTGVSVSREPTYEEWHDATLWAQRVEKASPFWVGDLIAMGESKFGEKYSQALISTGYAEQTLRNITYVSNALPPERRLPTDVVPWSVQAEVAPLTPDQQTYWLDKCREEGLSREELRSQIKHAKAEATGQALEYWLVVRCTDPTDQASLAERLRLEGRSVKYQ